MKKIIFFSLIFFPLYSFAQVDWTAKFPVKTGFETGESHMYKVTEFFKIDDLLFGNRYQIESTVFFQVVDTASGGYWIQYSVYTNAVSQRKDSSAYFMAALMNGINLFVYVKDGYVQLDSATYFNTKKKIAADLDSIASGQNNKKHVEYLQNELKKEDGLGLMLSPLGIFETYYSSGVFKKFRSESDGQAENILNKPLFTGIVQKEWLSTSKDSTVVLDYLFTGDRVHAAQYYKSIYDPILAAKNIKRGRFFYPPEMKYVTHYTFRTQPHKSFPSYLFKKNVSEYIFRSVLKIEMTEMPN